jgi:hypothetical protein
VLDEVVMTKIAAVVQYLGEKVAIASIIHNDISVVALLDHPVEGDHIRMR